MITSTANQQVRQLIQLNKKAKCRNAQDAFVTEGIKMFREAPEERIRKVYAAESLYQKLADDPASAEKQKLDRVPCEIVDDSVFRTMSDTMTPQGILCVLQQYHYRLEDLLQKENPLFIVLENLQDPGNLGTIFRTAEGAGAAGVIMSRETVDVYNPKTIRGTMGSIYRVPFLYEEDLCRTVERLRNRGVRSYAAHMTGAKTYDREDYLGGTAFLIGNEGNGLSEELCREADACIRIPMEGMLESLNAAIAASLLLYEAYRQRGAIRRSKMI